MKYLLLLLLASPAFAQVTEMHINTISSGGKVTPTLTWSNPTATSCSATGDAAWAAASKPVSGAVTLPAVSPPNARSYTLTCVFGGDNTATVSWAAPTTNTDGSPLTNLKGFKVYRETDQSLIGSPSANTRTITSPTSVTTTFTGLPNGTWWYGVTAVNTNEVESAMSNIASKVAGVGTTDSETVSIAFPGTTIITVR